MKWKFLWIVVPAITAAAYAIFKKRTYTFEEYCSKCQDEAKNKLMKLPPAKKTILVLTTINADTVAPFLYRRMDDGKIIKVRIAMPTFKLGSCPEEIREDIAKGNYIITKY